MPCVFGAAGQDPGMGGGSVMADHRPFVTHMPVASPETEHERTTGRGHVLLCFLRPGDPHSTPHHSNMLMYLCSALIGPSDARPCSTCVRGKPPVSPPVRPPPLCASVRC